MDEVTTYLLEDRIYKDIRCLIHIKVAGSMCTTMERVHPIHRR